MRYIILGSKALVEGFALVGFETFPDATPEQVETVLLGLLKHQDKALVVIENTLTHPPSSPEEVLPAISRARREAAWLVISEIPPLNSPEIYCPSIETLITRVLGESVLESKYEHTP